jgi:hypothetical protein
MSSMAVAWALSVGYRFALRFDSQLKRVPLLRVPSLIGGSFFIFSLQAHPLPKNEQVFIVESNWSWLSASATPYSRPTSAS